MSFDKIQGGRSFPIDRAGAGGGGLSAPYELGVATVGIGTTFLYPPSTNAANGAATILVAGQKTVLFTGTLRNFYLRHGNPAGATAITYTLFLNGVATAVVLVLSSGGTLVSDLVSTLAVTAGDSLAVQSSQASGGLLGVRAVWEMLLVE